MEVTITLTIPLGNLSRSKAGKLAALQAEYERCAVWHLEKCQELDTTAKTRIHAACYREATTLFDLNTGILQAARDKALAAQRSYLARKRKGRRASPPRFNGNTPVSLRQDSYHLVRSQRDNWLIRFPLRSGHGTQVAFPLLLRPNQVEKIGEVSTVYRQGSAELYRRGDGWFLAMTLTREHIEQEVRRVLGVDMGIVNHAVVATPDGQFVRFFPGKAERSRRERFAKQRAELQAAGRHTAVKRQKGKERRWMRDVNHKLSRQIVDLAVEMNAAIAVEKLTGISERVSATRKVNRMVNSWTFRQLYEMIRYKAAIAGVPVVEVDPRYTSCTCPRCGHVDEANRVTQAVFRCRRCGYGSNADRVAAINIARKGQTLLEEAGSSRLTSGVA